MEIQTILKDFQIDRPTMNKANTIEFLLQLLKGEVQEFEESPTEDEIADILIFALNITNAMGLDADEIVRTKIAYNSARYPSYEFQDGDYNDARKKCKGTEVIWKKVFYPSNPPDEKG